MDISPKDFIASQALYGLMIAKPSWDSIKLVQEAYDLAEMMINESKTRSTIKEINTNRQEELKYVGQ